LTKKNLIGNAPIKSAIIRHEDPHLEESKSNQGINKSTIIGAEEYKN
jgi:hypothetical protein